jgi:hypothetical protein
MNKKSLIILGSTLLVCVILGGVVIYAITKNNTPEKKVEQLEKKVNDAKETSGYNACVAKLDEREKAQKDCTTAKLAEAGYKDGVNCIGCGEYLGQDMTYSPEHQECNVCKSTDRYNAEVYGGNDCIPITNKITSLTLADCIKLLNDN